MLRCADITPAVVRGAQSYLVGRACARAADAGTAGAWKDFYRLSNTLIRRFAAARGLHGEALEDCVQDVWLELVAQLGDFEYDPRRGQFSSWLYVLVRNTVAGHARDRRRRAADPIDGAGGAALAAPEQDDPARRVEAQDSRIALRRQVVDLRAQITPAEYKLLEMRLVQNRSIAEVSSALGIPVQQVPYRLHRLKQKVHQLIVQDY